MSQRDVPQYLAFYPYEFLGDERVIAMTIEQVGAYLLLICNQWINGSIPADIPTLARMLKRTTAEMEMLWAGVGPCFAPHATIEGRLVQKRVEEERQKTIAAMEKSTKRQAEYREKRRLAALRDGDVDKQKRDMNKPSLLISSYIKNTTKEENTSLEDWEQFKGIYPPHRLDEEPALRAFMARSDEADEILAGTRLWVSSPDWTTSGGKWVKWASGFISNGIYKTKPLSEIEAAPSTPESTMDPETRRRLEERKRGQRE